MGTSMDTKIAIIFPFYFSEIIVDDKIVSSRDWGRFMTGDGHDGEMIVSGKLRIVDWAMPKIMEGEFSKLWRFDCIITLKLEGTCEGFDRFSLILTLMVQIIFILKT